MDRLGDGLAVVPSAPLAARNGDVDHPFRPGSDLYYLTGFAEPEAVLVCWRRGRRRGDRLYVRPRHKEREIWDGPRAGVAGAKRKFGLSESRPVEDLHRDLHELIGTWALGDAALFHGLGRDDALDRTVLRAASVAVQQARRRAPGLPTLVDPAPVLARMRQIKDAEELEAMRAAARLSAAGHLEAMRTARPGRMEYEVQAAMEAVFRAGGSERNGYESICASGPNACVLHWVENDRKLRKGDLMLIDAGAEVGGYTADITRTFPVDGTWSAPQRAVYDAVLTAQRAAIRAARVGRPVTAVHKAAVRSLTRGLVRLGVLGRRRGQPSEPTRELVDALVEDQAYRRFYMHGTSHWLGMDVHDVGPYQDAAGKPLRLQAGMVLTVEPGLYFQPGDRKVPAPFRGLGVRIEDDVAVTDEGPEILTVDVPKDPAAVAAGVRGEARAEAARPAASRPSRGGPGGPGRRDRSVSRR